MPSISLEGDVVKARVRNVPRLGKHASGPDLESEVVYSPTSTERLLPVKPSCHHPDFEAAGCDYTRTAEMNAQNPGLTKKRKGSWTTMPKDQDHAIKRPRTDAYAKRAAAGNFVFEIPYCARKTAQAALDAHEGASQDQFHADVDGPELYTTTSPRIIRIPPGGQDRPILALELSYDLSQKLQAQFLASRQYRDLKTKVEVRLDEINEAGSHIRSLQVDVDGKLDKLRKRIGDRAPTPSERELGRRLLKEGEQAEEKWASLRQEREDLLRRLEDAAETWQKYALEVEEIQEGVLSASGLIPQHEESAIRENGQPPMASGEEAVVTSTVQDRTVSRRPEERETTETSIRHDARAVAGQLADTTHTKDAGEPVETTEDDQATFDGQGGSTVKTSDGIRRIKLVMNALGADTSLQAAHAEQDARRSLYKEAFAAYRADRADRSKEDLEPKFCRHWLLEGQKVTQKIRRAEEDITAALAEAVAASVTIPDGEDDGEPAMAYDNDVMAEYAIAQLDRGRLERWLEMVDEKEAPGLSCWTGPFGSTPDTEDTLVENDGHIDNTNNSHLGAQDADEGGGQEVENEESDGILPSTQTSADVDGTEPRFEFSPEVHGVEDIDIAKRNVYMSVSERAYGRRRRKIDHWSRKFGEHQRQDRASERDEAGVASGGRP